MDNDSPSLLSLIAILLTVIGAVNWGLIGMLNFDLVAYLLGPLSSASKLVYTLVGISGLSTLILLLTSKIKY